ncbi:hypothetical protein KRR38_33550 [Novosphingobium sp. G106]|uniref:hypothetical protein n=1 Tax=Novosphingobium sp. G106 TaxID=2849500 RepID=UPI001C2DF0F7|nr:hypothetical protein [Novosphingobium sp. G106]MBV1692163.1 hypothetical protein [Novosphingobium sp. G106]MBV1692432.1 hypothetical protein [Novosphingobium sp. G106]
MARLGVSRYTSALRLTVTFDMQALARFTGGFSSTRLNGDTEFGESSLSIDAGLTNWLAGAVIQNDGYRSKTFPVFNYVYTVPGVFAQIETRLPTI